MSRPGMPCPHCEDKDAVFQTVEPVKLRPVVEGWAADDPTMQTACSPDLIWECVACGGRVRIDLNRREIDKDAPRPIVWDDWMETCLGKCKTARDTTVPGRILDNVRERGIPVPDGLTTKQLLKTLILKKP